MRAIPTLRGKNEAVWGQEKANLKGDEMARQFESLEAFIEWATANGWTVERETWTVEMTQVFVQSPDREWSGSTEEMRLSDYQRRPGAFDREAWKDAWLNWEHERAKSDKE